MIRRINDSLVTKKKKKITTDHRSCDLRLDIFFYGWRFTDFWVRQEFYISFGRLLRQCEFNSISCAIGSWRHSASVRARLFGGHRIPFTVVARACPDLNFVRILSFVWIAVILYYSFVNLGVYKSEVNPRACAAQDVALSFSVSVRTRPTRPLHGRFFVVGVIAMIVSDDRYWIIITLATRKIPKAARAYRR